MAANPSQAPSSEVEGAPIASYADYPIIAASDGALKFDPYRAKLLAEEILEEKNIYGAYELVYLVDDLRIKDVASGQRLDGDLLSRLRELAPIALCRRLSTERNALIQAIVPIVEGFGKTLAGCDIEVALHDVRNPMGSVVCIENTITGRSAESPMTNFGVTLIRRHALKQISLSHHSYSLTLEGRQIKSSTIPIPDAKGRLIGLLCINIDASWYEMADSGELEKLLSAKNDHHQVAVDRIIRLLKALGRADNTQPINENLAVGGSARTADATN